jgi:uncharacterized protein YukE
MSTAMDVDPDGLRDAAPRFDAVAADVQDALVRLGASLDGEGACWGNDQIGASFEASYAPMAERTRAAFGLLCAGVADVGAALSLAADNADGADGRAADRMA